MGYVFDLCDAIETVDINETVRLCIQQTSYEITALNATQLNEGVDSTGSQLKPYDPKLKYYGKEYPAYRKEYYQVFKHAINPTPGLGTPDLFLTGEFYKGLGVVVNSTEYTVNSNSVKAPSLELRYGYQIYGMTETNQTKYVNETLYPAIFTNLKNQLGL